MEFIGDNCHRYHIISSIYDITQFKDELALFIGYYILLVVVELMFGLELRNEAASCFDSLSFEDNK